MTEFQHAETQINYVSNFQDLISTPFQNQMNAVCWKRELTGDFSEIVKKLVLVENITVLDPEDLLKLELSEQGQLARQVILNDLELLKAHGASPVLNLISCYDRDDSFFSTDVYSFHVDRSPVPTDTFLCTYHGASSEIIPNSQAEQKILIPEIRDELKKLFHGPDEKFESFLSEHFFDLHYQLKNSSLPISCGIGHVWRLAVDYPESKAFPCVHRAPKEKAGENRLLLIC